MIAARLFTLVLLSLCLHNAIWCEDIIDGSTVSVSKKEYKHILGTIAALQDQVSSLTNRYENLHIISEKYKGEIETVTQKLVNIQKQPNSNKESVQACGSSPCQNGATCVDADEDTFLCMCRDGYFGTTCGNSYSGATFMASFTDDIIYTVEDPLVFDLILFGSGGHYDTSTGIYTVPYNGTYKFDIRISTYDDNAAGYFLTVDGTEHTNSFIYHPNYPIQRPHTMIILSLREGQQVTVRPNSIESYYGKDGNVIDSWFSGYLIDAY